MKARLLNLPTVVTPTPLPMLPNRRLLLLFASRSGWLTRWRWSVSCAWLSVLLCGLLGSGRAATAFFVAPTGSDTNAGTKAAPFATLEAARDAVRTLRHHGPLPVGGITIWLRGGNYIRTHCFTLTAEDTGSASAPVVYRAWPGERARLLGGCILHGFRPVKDPHVLARLAPKARAHVLQVDLHALGIRHFPPMQSRGFSRPTRPSQDLLFFDGHPMQLARWPNSGHWAHIAGFPAAGGQPDEHGGHIGKLTNGFYYSGDRPRRWEDVSDLWVHGFWTWDWADSYERVASLDLSRHLIKTAPPYGVYGFRPGQRFYFLNILEELDQPGEWYLDRKTGILYFWPPNPISQGDALLSRLGQPLIRMNHVSHVTFRGMILEATRGNAVVIDGGTSNLIAACLIRNIGDWGVRIDGGHDNGVNACDIWYTGDGGVSLSGGDRQTLTPGGEFVVNCHFKHQGDWVNCYVPAVLVNGVGQRVAHNVIHHHPHCAILFGGNNHLIEFNEIYHVALETGDVGAIYSGRDWTFRGNQIRYNYIHDTGGVGMGSMGVYMDDCVSGTTIYGNVFKNVQRAVFLGGGRDHQVINNIFIDCHPAVQVDGRGLDHSPVWHNMVYQIMRKRLAAVPQALYRARYPALKALDRYYATTNGVPPENNVIARNICVGKWLQVGWHAQHHWLKLKDNLVGKDPKFVAGAKPDFQLQPDSPAWKLGFVQIPFRQIGLQQDALRREVEALEPSH